jgi:hypothetical protein
MGAPDDPQDRCAAAHHPYVLYYDLVVERLTSLVGLCYAVSLIDRTNISAARVAGMQVSLQLQVGDRYSIISLLFFVPYIIFVSLRRRSLGRC